MSEAKSNHWQPMEHAPKDGTRVLVEVRASEQGPAEIDVARWAKIDRSGEGSWIAADSDPGCIVVYAEAELLCWMHLPAVLPKLRPVGGAVSQGKPPEGASAEEIAGSGI